MLSKIKDGVTSILSKFSKEEVDDTLANVHVITIPVVFDVGRSHERHCNYLLKRNHSDTIRTYDVIGRLPKNEDDILDNPVIKDIILPWTMFDSGITFEMLQEAAVGMPTAFYFNDRNFSWYGEMMQIIRESDDPYVRHLVKSIDNHDDKFFALCAFTACLTIIRPTLEKTDIFDRMFQQYRYFPSELKEMHIKFMTLGFIPPTSGNDSDEAPISSEEPSELSHEQKLEYVVQQFALAGKDLPIQDKMLLHFTALRLQGADRVAAVDQTLTKYKQSDGRTPRSIVNAWTKQSSVAVFQVLPEALPLPDFVKYKISIIREKYIDQVYNKLIKRS